MFCNNKKDDDGNMQHSFDTVKKYFSKKSKHQNVAVGSAMLFGGYSINVIINRYAKEILWIAGTSLGLIGSVGTSIWIVSHCLYNRKQHEIGEEETQETDYDKYITFVNKDYDTFIEIYKSNTEKEYCTASASDISDLSHEENHQSFSLPYSYNPEMKFYYDDKADYYYYYSQSDVNSKILNSVCRSYTLMNKCIHLFKDDEEVSYMKKEAKYGEYPVSIKEEPSAVLSDVGAVLSDVGTDNESDTEESPEGFINIFYKKKNNRKDAIKKQPKLRTNNFLYKGTLVDYEKEYLPKQAPKNMSYQNYMKSLENNKKIISTG